MRTCLVGFFGLIVLAGCGATNGFEGIEPTLPSWHLVFANDASGQVEEGSRDALIAAVRSGKPVRVFTEGRRVAHAADAQFLSVFEGEVFAQLSAIESQRPELEPLGIYFREPGQQWRSIVGTNGFVTAFTDGSEPNVRQGGARWFVQH